MAPASQQTGRSRPGSAKPIVPAIPLPYMQKRKQQTVATKKVEDRGEVTNTVIPSSSTSTDTVPATTNGTVNSAPSADATPPAASSTSSITPSADEGKGSTAEAQDSSGPTSSENENEQTPPLAASDYHSSTSQSTHDIVPPVVPTSQNYSLMSGDAVRFPKHPSFGYQRPMHQAHPSAGSLVFGGYTDSNGSSPVPPHSGISVGHNFQPFPDTRRVDGPSENNGGPALSFPNGFIPMVSAGPPEFSPRQETTFNEYNGAGYVEDGQKGALGSPNGFQVSGVGTAVDNQRPVPSDLSTPHSFHGSHSSVQNEQEFSRAPFIGGPYHPAVTSNDSNGHAEESRYYQHGRSKNRTGSQSVNMGPATYAQPVSQPPIPVDNFDGLVGYLQSQFADPRYADYIIELRYTDDRATPVQIPGHTIILARSPTLKDHIAAKARDSSHGQSVKTLLLESNDRFLRSDAFWLAVQRLYGGPLLDPGAPATVSALTLSQLSSGTPGTPADRFDLALGYAAAGHLLQMPPVVNRGVDIASHFINWVTVEKALDFSLDGGLGPQWMHEPRQNAIFPNTYGPVVDMLIHSTLSFLITAFPPNFEFDPSVPEPPFNRRTPFIPDIRVSIPNPRLTNIRFGDHATEDEKPTVANTPTAVLSKILLNLPFQLLKYILESPRLGNVHGWATQTLRLNVMHAVINEREKRRNRARESKIVPNTERTANYHAWEVVGWQESVTQPYNPGEVPTLTRTWVDFVLPNFND